jgi:uncharacterized membrane protein (UPF0127 family)
MTVRLFRAVVLVLLLAVPAAGGVAQEPVQFPVSKLTIETATGSHPFTVEVATDSFQHARGLMYRRELAPDRGMIFLYEKEEEVLMWMKNTYVSLDMLFMDRTGRIVGIAANATPLSTDIIPSNAPVKAVLEVAAGTAARLKIEVGNQVIHPAFAPEAK